MITFDRVSVTYSGAVAPVLRDVSFTVPEGDLCVVIGRTGTGKSTLLQSINGLVPHITGGTLSGEVQVGGRSTARVRPRELADLVGYVGQDPVAGFVTDTVEEELAYGMEQLGLPPETMRKRVEETLDLLGLASLRRRALSDLSGGQQQRVAIGSVLAAHPQVLVLDEPTSALDPTAAQDVLGAITQLVRDVGMTVVIAEHRLERVIDVADSSLWLRGDGGVRLGTPAEVLAQADITPPLVALGRALEWDPIPLSVRDARRRARSMAPLSVMPATEAAPGPAIVRVDKVSVRYGAVVAVEGVSLELAAGTVTALMGRNGSGKSSLLWAIQGTGARSSGSVSVLRNSEWVGSKDLSATDARRLICLVPQSAADLLYLETVAEECTQADTESGVPPGTTAKLLSALGADLPPDLHPRDLSEGQRLALVLAIQLAPGPAVILLDEPTRGLDYQMKAQLRQAIRRLADAGSTVVVSTHDVEFAAAATDRTVVMADGEIVASGPTRAVCTASPAFAPQVAKVFAPAAVLTVDDVLAAVQS